jgi:poly(3-hydroxybutyrate) depolymerase
MGNTDRLLGNQDDSTHQTEIALLTWPCPHDANVYLCRIDGGGHAWLGSAESAALASFVGPTTFQIFADAEMWKFFKAHPLR